MPEFASIFSALSGTGAPALAGPGSSALAEVIGSDTLLAACLLLLATCVGLAILLVVLRAKASLSMRLARRRAMRMADLMRTVRLAEDIAALGVWQYDLDTAAQHWSNGLRRIFGVDHDEPFVEGDAETLLFANDVDLVGAVSDNVAEPDPYALNFDIYGFDGLPKSLSVQVCNLRGKDGQTARIVAVVRDVTEQIAQLRNLEFSRAAAMREANKARALAETDPLTGLANRRHVMDRLDRMIVDSRQCDRSLVIVVFDIDHFKTVNDTYGHLEGDCVLKAVANIAKGQARGDDVVARIGGEEFVWVVPGASEGTARIMSERLRHCVAAESATGDVPAVTISVGFAELLPGDTSLSLFARADGALYEAKHAGRNRVRMAA